MQDTLHDDSHGFRLSSYDVEMLMRDNSPRARTDILSKVARQYRVQHFSDHELMLAEQIFRILMKDVELAVRRQLAEEVKDMDTVPRDIILHLVQDVEEVSIPVIEMSQVLSDADLVQLVESTRDTTKIEAVTRRASVSERVSDALVESHYPQVVESLLLNPNAQIAEKAMETVIRDFRREPKLLENLAAREVLPLTIVEKLVHATSSSISAKLKERYVKRLDDAEQKARESTMLKLLETASGEGEIEAFIAELYDEHRLTPSIMFMALARGQFTFFALAIARLVHIPGENALKLLLDTGPLGFPALYQRSGLPESMQPAVRAMLRIVTALRAEGVVPGTREYANLFAMQLLGEAEQQEIQHLPYMLALIRGK